MIFANINKMKTNSLITLSKKPNNKSPIDSPSAGDFIMQLESHRGGESHDRNIC